MYEIYQISRGQCGVMAGAVIVERIKDTRGPFYRPTLPQEESAGVHPDILTLMKQCWADEPSERPSFVEVDKILKTINKGKSVRVLIDFVLQSDIAFDRSTVALFCYTYRV